MRREEWWCGAQIKKRRIYKGEAHCFYPLPLEGGGPEGRGLAWHTCFPIALSYDEAGTRVLFQNSAPLSNLTRRTFTPHFHL